MELNKRDSPMTFDPDCSSIKDDICLNLTVSFSRENAEE